MESKDGVINKQIIDRHTDGWMRGSPMCFAFVSDIGLK